MKNKYRITALVGLGLALAQAPLAHADSVDPDAGAASQASLDQRVSVLEQRLALLSPLSGTSTAFQGSPASAFASVNRGIGFVSSDGNYGIKFGGTFQEDDRSYFDGGLNSSKGLTQQSQLTNEFVDARARLLVDAYLGSRVHVRYQEDFSNNGGNSGSANLKTLDGAELVDAYGELRLLPWVLLRVGQFKNGLDIERWRQTPAADFIQFGYTAGLVVDRSQGAELEVADPGQVFYLSAGAVDGSTDTGNPVVQAYNNDKDAVARLFFQPFNAVSGHTLGDLGAGLAAEGGDHSGSPDPTYKSLGQESIVATTGNVLSAYIQGAGYNVAPQAYWFWRQFSLLGEYVRESDNYRLADVQQQNDTVDSEAWQAQAGWVLTGERSSYDGVKLDKGSRAWGSLELVARIQGADYDEGSVTAYNPANGVIAASKGLLDPEASVTALKSWSVGLNYIPVNDVKFLVDWDQTYFDNGGVNDVYGAGGKVTGVVLADRPSEEALQVRAQFAF